MVDSAHGQAYSSVHGLNDSPPPNTIKETIMKRTIISIALTSLLAACGAGSDAQPVASEQQKPVEQVAPVAQKQQDEEPKIKVEEHREHLDPQSNQGGIPFEPPKAEEEVAIEDWQLKFLNMGVARAVVEYKMVGEALKAELAAQMGEGFDAWIKADTERCVEDQKDTFRDDIAEHNRNQAKLMCAAQAYGYWAMVNGTSGTEGTPRQCLEKGYCGFMFKQYDLTADPVFAPMNGLDSEF